MMASDPRFLSGLPVLAAVIECKSFVRAGEALGLTQSGVSRAIQRLEERLSIRIFERTSKIVRLTDDGKALCEDALPLLAQLEDERKTFRESLAGSFAQMWIPLLPGFFWRHASGHFCRPTPRFAWS